MRVSSPIRAFSLAEHLRSKGLRAEVINEESLGIAKATAYSSEFNEKKTRGALKSAADRALGTETFTILDALNYIKGYRYELYCISRTQRTPHCVVRVHSPDLSALRWNALRGEGEGGYDMRTLLELRRRYEAPSDRNRWDAPLFHVRWPAEDTKGDEAEGGAAGAALRDDSESKPERKTESLSEPVAASVASSSWRRKTPRAQADVGEGLAAPPLPPPSSALEDGLSFSGSLVPAASDAALSPAEACERILEYFATASAPKPNSSTVAIPHATADLLYELDKVSQEIVSAVVLHARDNVEGTPLVFRSFARVLEMHRVVALNELQRHRRMFVKVNSQHPPASSLEIGASFIDFLAAQL